MAAEVFRNFRATLYRRRHTALLITIIFALTVRPLLGDTGITPVFFSLAMLALLLLALFAVQIDELAGEREVLVVQRRRSLRIAWVLAAIAVFERVYLILFPTQESLRIGTLAWLLFLGFIIWSLLRHLLRHREVTGETISMSVSIYLLMGIMWGVLYVLVLEFQPEAFHFGEGSLAITPTSEAHTFPILVYFSLTTLSTVGYGDITPVTMLARYLAVAEGITGQFYLAILVARLVGMHMSRQ